MYFGCDIIVSNKVNSNRVYFEDNKGPETDAICINIWAIFCSHFERMGNLHPLDFRF